MPKTTVPKEVIEEFLSGTDPQKYIVAVEAPYNKTHVTLVVNDPDSGKRLEEHPYRPFFWFKHEATPILYDGKKLKTIEACKRYGVKITGLKVSDADGLTPSRLENGYRYLATCSKTYNDLVNFFKEGGIDVFDKEFSSMFLLFSPSEQFLMQSGKRLFKGMDDYDDIHRLQFDLETTGLNPKIHSIFQIGIKDNKNFETILETTGTTEQQKRDSERINIQRFFQVIDILKPDLIAGYYSENFDWDFIFQRCERLSIPVTELAITLSESSRIKRKAGMIKLGGESEPYMQTSMYGYNIIDICHSVRRAMAINSDIQSWSLKYITKYSKIAKPNRVYVPGSAIHTTWADKGDFAFDNTNGDWYKITAKTPIRAGYEMVKGDYIIQRYLLDDLWETEKVDIIFNQATFLIAKLLPTTYQRASTMGTSGQWKLIMAAWSYQNGLAIPSTEKKREFTGGLSKLLEVGYSPNVVKLDYAALYPKTELTWDIFPSLDISGAMAGMLSYVVDTRDYFKNLTTKHKEKVIELENDLKDNKNLYSPERIAEIEKEIIHHSELKNLYDKKQLPLKILANSWFGSYGAPYIFNWGETDCAEETTCRGRQYLRLMVRHFTEKYGFRALVGDSVTFDTPIYLLNNETKEVEIKPICDIFDPASKLLDEDGLRDYDKKPYLILTTNGWKGINYVYRHETEKNIHRISTKDRMVCVTEDHSLFKGAVQVKPSTLVRGDVIDVYDYPIYQNSRDVTNEDLFWLYGFFLGDGSAIYGPRKQYYKSKKTGNINTNKGTRGDWKISNTNLKFLEKLKDIVEREFFVKAEIKNHLKSSGVYDLVVNNSVFAKYFSDNFYTSYREKAIPAYVLNTSKINKIAFMNGVCASDGYGNDMTTVSDIGMKSQVAMAGLGYLLKGLGLDYKLKLRSDKPNFISFKLRNRNRNNSAFTSKTKMETDTVWSNTIIQNRDKSKFVYDISTEDGTFIGGVGAINLKNTDGFNFAFPDNINDVKYLAKGTHWKTEENAGKELVGLQAVLAEFNENYMIGRMGLDIDDICEVTINFSRKNYANLINGKVKLVGNSIKNKKMPVYIEEFIHKGVRQLLEGKGYEFIEYYYEYVNKIYNYNIPLVKIASKSKVNSSIVEYKKKANQKNKAGNPMPKQAHMELALMANLEVNQGDVIYYVNTGSAKSHGDLKTIRDKETGAVTIQLNCKLIDNATLEADNDLIKELEVHRKNLATLVENAAPFDEQSSIIDRIEEIENNLATDEYNVARYLAAFNKKVEPLLVCFDPEIRDQILISIKKDKKDKVEKLQERPVFTSAQCKLISGKPNKEKDQDDYTTHLMTMEDKEIKFWDKVNKTPNNILQEEWDKIRADYHVRLAEARIEGIAHEREKLEDIFKHLELTDFSNVEDKGILPIDILIMADVDSEGEPYLVSRKWDERLCHITDIFKYKDEAVERAKYYISNGLLADINKYDIWLDYKAEQAFMTGHTLTEGVTSETIENVASLIKENSKDVTFPVEPLKKTKKKSEDDEEDDDEEEEVNNDKEEISDFLPELEFNAYIEEVGPVHVDTRPNIKVYPTHIPINPKPQINPVVVEEPKEEVDEWGF